jgi:non-specific serine/threonine protein kinase
MAGMARWTFGGFVFDLETRELLRSDMPVALSPKAFHLLGILVEDHARALSKRELQERLWPGTFVVEKNLTNLVSEIREALGDDPVNPRFIRTVHRFGYAFCETPAIQRSGTAFLTPDPAAADVRRDNLPVPLTHFIGRADEMAELLPLLDSTRLLTLTGAGGCGKTRLALELAAKVLPQFSDGVWAVDLAALSDPDLVISQVASALGLREGPNRPIDVALGDFLRPRQMLILLDNCEHLIEACAHLAERLLQSAGRLSILATSREGLGITGETIWRVPSLALPDSPAPASADTLAACDAVRLFIERAHAVDASFSATPATVALVAQVCQRLDGIPLAIELAAARVKVLSIEQIHARLHDRFRLLTGGSRTAVARQRTLEAAVDWSYELLSEEERRLLRRLSVFAGGWTIETAEAVTSGDGLERTHVLNLLSRLVDKSLVNIDATGESRRYRLLETVRQYGYERLREPGEAERLRDRHLACFGELIRRAEPELMQSDQVTWLNRLDVEHDNLRSALEWCLASPARRHESLDLASGLSWFWLKRGYFREGQACLEHALAGGDAPAGLRAKAIMGLGSVTFFRGDLHRTQALAAEGVDLGRASGDPVAVSYLLGMLSMVALERDDLTACARLAGEGLAAARASDASWVQGVSLSALAYHALHEGDRDRAGRLHEEALALSRARGEKWAMGISLFDLALLRVMQQRHAEARAHCAEGIALSQEFGDRRGVAWCLGILSAAEVADGRALRAARLRGAMEGLLESVGAPVQDSYHRLIGDVSLEAMKAALGAAACEAAVAEGRRMSPARAIELAMAMEV